ncbi:choice-of-anchor Q domain-containing protein [Ferruginibacter albus]|uniref:choice-of-anchor Q domain-containing protein n=1 Tax=Ferruginibacter albus TaxID=2875540 RepID=UPI001CC45A63|nr:choice-of-anchor Q domain-containing protein [Ferruginibacter albus]UAY53163.1 right-handed parallel beta-helix repeat-containing protein [Ferruginibacter albus]
MKKSILLAFLIALVFCKHSAAQTTRFVMQVAQGIGDGSSWSNASSDLQSIINASAAGDSVFVAKGIYIPIDSSFTMKEGVKIFGSFNGTENNVAQRIFGNDENDSSILSGKSNTYIVKNDSNYLSNASVLDGFVLTHSFGLIGGGIYNKYVSPLLTNLIIKQNNSDVGDGGGIYNLGSSPVITNCIITDNKATNGGGIFNLLSAPTLINLFITDNTAVAKGGGIYCVSANATNTIRGCIISNNTSVTGGGVLSGNSDMVFEKVKLIGNTGGGFTDASGVGKMQMENSLITGNNGDAISTLSNLTITNVTIAGNGGLGLKANATGVVINSCIIYANASGISVPIVTSQVLYSDIQGNGIAGTNIDTDPLFLLPSSDTVPFTNGDYRLQSISPAVNKGDIASAASGLDLGGLPRIIDNRIDMGAYEFPVIKQDTNGIVYVKKGGAGNYTGDSWANAAPELADALSASTIDSSIHEIWVGAGTYTPSYIAGNGTGDKEKAFVLVNNVSVYGGFAGIESSLSQRDVRNPANASILSGDLNGNDGTGFSNVDDNVYHVIVSAGNDKTALLDGFTISGGNANSADSSVVNNYLVYHSSGSGIYLNSSSPTLQDLKVNGNKAINSGGGIFADQSSPFIIKNIIENNTAENGAGIANEHSSSPAIINSLVINNVAADNGGGVYNADASNAGFVNTVISNNSALNGAGMYNSSGSPSGGASLPTIINSIVYDNNGAAFGQDDIASHPSISYSIIEGSGGSSNWQPAFGTDNGNNLDTDPLFMGNNNYELKGASPAINDGTPDTSGLYLPDLDLENKNRVLSNRIDIGAYEFMGVLPVTLINFTGNATKDQTSELHWQTTSEVNTSYFVIERSIDAKNFVTIETINAVGLGNNKYDYIDSKTLQSAYYRLRIVDKNGTVKYSNIIYMSFNTLASSITVFPNPATSFVTVVTNNKTLAGTTAILYDLNGQTLQRILLGSKSTVISLNGLSSGDYLLHVQTGETFKVIVK